MCTTPVLIKNPYYKLSHIGLNFTKDTVSTLIPFPCGHCLECRQSRQFGFIQRAQVEAENSMIFFVTLTYDNEHLPSLDVEIPVVVDENTGDELYPLDSSFVDSYKTVSLPYADIHDIQLLLKRMRDNIDFEGRSFKYVAVSELGKQRGRPHFHMMLFLGCLNSDYFPSGRVKPSIYTRWEKLFYDFISTHFARNIGTRKNPIYIPLFTYKQSFRNGKLYTNYDCHYVQPADTVAGNASVAFYVSKYIMKSSDRERRRAAFLKSGFSDSDFRSVWSVIKSKMVCSKGFGVRGHFERVEYFVDDPEETLCEYSKKLDDFYRSVDLPLDFPPVAKKLRVSRILVPDEELIDSLHSNIFKNLGKSEFPSFVCADGKISSLSRYYYRFSKIFSDMDLLTLWFGISALPDSDVTPFYNPSRVDKAIHHLSSIQNLIDSHGSFDNLFNKLPSDYEDVKFIS